MDETINQFLKELERWFTQRPLWLQDAAGRIFRKDAIDATDLEELTILCKQEAGPPDSIPPTIKAPAIPAGAFRISESPATIRLEEISNVKGINALSPRKPLNFGDGPLTIIYGTTGSGKSGYVRILKHACGAKDLGVLHGNIFDNQKTNQECTFKVNINTVSKELHWSPPTGLLEDIKVIEIYDTDCAHVYLTKENEVAYEPSLLSLFTQLTNICTHVGKTLKDEIDQSASKIPFLPIQHQNTKSAYWYSSLSHQTKQREIDARCLWNQRFQNALTVMNRRLSEPDPEARAKALRKNKTSVQALHDELKRIRNKLSDDKGSKYITSKEDALAKRRAANEDAKKVFENAPLDGVGSESWQLLWEQARIYSETIAYEGIEFPNLSEEARCILCHQLLSPEARERFTSFEGFVKGELQKQATKAEERAMAIKEEIEDISSANDILLRIDSASITTIEERNEILKFYALLIKRKNSILKAKSSSEFTNLPDENLLEKLKTHYKTIENRSQ